MPGDSGVTVVTTLVCSFYFAYEAAGASSARHSLRPLGADGSRIARAHRAARMRGHGADDGDGPKWEPSPSAPIGSSPQGEKNHGTKIFEEGFLEGRARDAGAQTRDIEERPLGAEGDEPQAGDRNWSLRGESRRTEGPEKDHKQETQVQQKTEVEAVGDAFRSFRHGRA